VAGAGAGGQAQQAAEHVVAELGRLGDRVAEGVLDQVVDRVAVAAGEAGGHVAGEAPVVAAEQLLERGRVTGTQPAGEGGVVADAAAAVVSGCGHDGRHLSG
jgi:hypothetical protein